MLRSAGSMLPVSPVCARLTPPMKPIDINRYGEKNFAIAGGILDWSGRRRRTGRRKVHSRVEAGCGRAWRPCLTLEILTVQCWAG